MPQRKLKWSADPQNSFWVKDETNFGHKMLSKMGWEKGKGLGRNESGLLDPVKLSKTSNAKGLGYSASYDNTWIAHQEDFSSILSNLNNDSSAMQENALKNSESKVVGLESISRNQKRIHYKKFAKGKDLTNYNETDMSCILGIKRPHSLPSTPLSPSDDSEGEISVSFSCKSKQPKLTENQNQVADEASDNNMTKFNYSKFNSNDYFKNRLEKVMEMKKISGSRLVTSFQEVNDSGHKPVNQKEIEAELDNSVHLEVNSKADKRIEENKCETVVCRKKRKDKKKKKKNKSLN